MQSSETSTLLKSGKLIHHTQLYVLFWSYFLVTDVTHAKKKVDLKNWMYIKIIINFLAAYYEIVIPWTQHLIKEFWTILEIQTWAWLHNNNLFIVGQKSNRIRELTLVWSYKSMFDVLDLGLKKILNKNR